MHCPLSKHMAVRQLIPESRFRLMEAPIGMPQSQKTVVGRPIKWVQCGCFFPLLGREPCVRGSDNLQSSAIRSQWLETSHHVWFNEPCCISTDELLETSSHLKVFVQTKAKTRHVFGSKFNCLEQLLCSLHRSLVTGTFRACDVNFLWFLRIFRSILEKFGNNFAGPASREPCQ